MNKKNLTLNNFIKLGKSLFSTLNVKTKSPNSQNNSMIIQIIQ